MQNNLDQIKNHSTRSRCALTESRDPTRDMEQVILEVIDSAVREVFVVSCAFYHAASIVDSVRKNSAGRDALIRILLERSTEHGGSVQRVFL